MKYKLIIAEQKSGMYGPYTNEITVSDKMVCPKCGGELVVRKGKYGEFYGCSNYAKKKCKYVFSKKVVDDIIKRLEYNISTKNFPEKDYYHCYIVNWHGEQKIEFSWRQ